MKLVTRSSRNKCRSFLISLSVYQTNLLSSPQSRDIFNKKEIVFNRCAKSHSRRNTGQPVENCDRFAGKSIRLPSNSSLVIFTILFQVKVKRQTYQLLYYKDNLFECQKKLLKHLDELFERLDKPLERLGKMLERQKNRKLSVSFLKDNRLSLVYVFPEKKVNYLGGQVGNQA